MRSELYFSKRKAITLRHVEGISVSYDGEELPLVFETPITIGDGPINGFNSGRRSAIVHSYKLKGCAPQNGKLYGIEPHGAMSKENCLSELAHNKKVSRVYEEYDINAPLYSRGFFEYDGGICCAIMECTGDIRMSEVHGQLLDLNKRHPDLWNYEYLNTLFLEIAKWVGFNHRILKEAGIAPIEESFDFDNYALHLVDGGFGIARVDLEEISDLSTLEFDKKKEFDIREVTREPGIICDVMIAKDSGIPYKNFRKGLHEGKSIMLTYSDVEWKEENEKEIILHIKQDRFKQVNAIKKYYLDFAEGTEIPEPISPKIITPLFY